MKKLHNSIKAQYAKLLNTLKASDNQQALTEQHNASADKSFSGIFSQLDTLDAEVKTLRRELDTLNSYYMSETQIATLEDTREPEVLDDDTYTKTIIKARDKATPESKIKALYVEYLSHGETRSYAEFKEYALAHNLI